MAPEPRADPSARARLLELAERLARQRHLGAVRDGVVAALPLVLVGSAFLLVAQPPIPALHARLEGWSGILLVPYRLLGGAIGLYVCLAVARALARSYGMDEAGTPLVALASFLVAQSPAQLEAGGLGLSLAALGPGGLFGAIAIGLLSVEVQRAVVGSGWTLRLPNSVPEAIGRSFQAIVPALVSVTLVWAVVHVAGLDLLGAVASAVAPLVAATDSLLGAWTVVLADGAMWLFGFHPVAILGALKPVWLSMLTENMAARADGLPLPHVATREFFLWFVWQGGSGGTLALALLLARARSRALRGVGRLGLVPSLFNVNEPILFGLPVVMNPRLAVPFLAAPLATATTTYLAMRLDWVARPHLEVLWTLPAPVGAYLATGGDARAVLLQCANLAISLVVWWPFVRAWDRRLLAGEGEGRPELMPVPGAPEGGSDARSDPGPARG